MLEEGNLTPLNGLTFAILADNVCMASTSIAFTGCDSTFESRINTRILFIEDDPSYQMLCKRYLRSDPVYDHVVVTASSAKEAIAIASVDVFDCIIVDYRLPDARGTDTIIQLRDMLKEAMPATIVLTADGGEQAAVHALRSRASDFLTKSKASKSALCRSVKNAIEKNRLSVSLVSRVKELEQANRLLKKRTTEIQRFYHTVSHEVKTPLTAIQEFVAIVHDGLAGDINEEQSTILNYALESCHQISKHFNDLLELSRFETGKMSVELRYGSFEKVLDHCIVSATPGAVTKGVTLEVSDPQPISPVFMQADRIIQVIGNLLGNAIKFTQPGGKVTLVCEPDDDSNVLRVAVKDTGCGIDQKDLTKIFDRLYQVDSTTEENRTGLGLGLCIAEEIVTLHGSQIIVESELGVGSEFSFELQMQPQVDKV